MDKLRKVVAEQIRLHRKARGLTQATLAEQAGVSVEMVSRIERRRCLLSVPTLVAFATALSTTPDVLLGFEAPSRAKDVQQLVATLDALTRARRKEILRIAEALVHYERL